MIKQPFSNVQLELLKVFSDNISEDNLLKLKKVLASFYYDIMVEEADKVWDEQGWTDKDVDIMLNTKMRSSKK